MRAAGFCCHCGMEEPGDARYAALSQDERFIVLRRKTGRAAILVTVLFMVWYFLYVAASVFAHGLVGQRPAGGVEVALAFGLLQFAVTFLLARRYTRYSRRVLDPLRAQVAADADRPAPVYGSER
jgi:uncharacterized membrane protein (DUF485 family)